MATLSRHPAEVNHPRDISKPDINPSLKLENSFIQDVQNVLKTPTARDAIRDDLHRLSDDLTAIEKDFNEVTTLTIKLDDRDILHLKFAPDWKKIHKDYTSLMHASRGIAADISNVLENFLTVNLSVLTNKNLNIERKKRNLSKYIKKLDSFIPTANENALQFLRLRQRVLGFKGDLLSEIKNTSLVDKQLEQIDKKIEQLQSTLQRSSNIFMKAWNFFLHYFPNIGGIASTTSLVNLAPTVGKTIMETVLAKLQSDLADALKKQRKGLEGEETKELQSKLETMREEVKNMHKEFADVVLDVDQLEIVLQGLNDKLAGIERIWRLLQTDARLLLSKLIGMSEAEDDSEFDLYVTSIEAVYKNLQDGLEAFCLAVRQ